MSRSFSAVDTKGVDVKGTVLYENDIRMYALVGDEDKETLWIVDTLEDVGVSLDAEQISNLLPRLESWMRQRTRKLSEPVPYCWVCRGHHELRAELCSGVQGTFG